MKKLKNKLSELAGKWNLNNKEAKKLNKSTRLVIKDKQQKAF
jgi:hypothetical protein